MIYPETDSTLAPARAFSLERRLMLRLGALYIGALIIVSAVYFSLAWSSRHIEVADDVDPIVTAIVNAVRVGPGGHPILNISPTLRARIDRLGDLKFAVVDRGTGQVVASSRTMSSPAEFAMAMPPSGYDGDYFLRTHKGATLYGAVRTIDTQAGQFWIEFQHSSKASTEAREWVWEELGTETMPVFLSLSNSITLRKTCV
jgi:hypothetical protein